MRDSGNQWSEGTLEGMFNFEPEPVVSDLETPPIIFPTLPTFYGPDNDETIIDLSVRVPKPPKPSPNIGKIPRKFKSDSRSRLHEAMTTSHSSANPDERDFAWEAYRMWINSKVSELKDFGYDLSKRNFHYGFVPLMEL